MQAWHQYVNDIELNIPSKTHASGEPSASCQERIFEAIMLQLRLTKGMNCSWFANGFGRDRLECVLHALRKHVHEGRVLFEVEKSSATLAQVMAAVDRQDVAHARLRDPDGLLLSNDIISDVFVALEE